ncbi:hypothetical protein RND71_014452 [Anisodus tanguticus]|uniref:Uncharacterized protein n=1 Tax=Anisodus tanguticus TaxID=243964 RepID=A0AAE1SBT7_9SOLA|nr:hypothetical protein RND71_014452 [Anisodus tanguticus]
MGWVLGNKEGGKWAGSVGLWVWAEWRVSGGLAGWPGFDRLGPFVGWPYWVEIVLGREKNKNDDILISDERVASVHASIIQKLGVQISSGKSLCSSTGCAEFSKRFLVDELRREKFSFFLQIEEDNINGNLQQQQ